MSIALMAVITAPERGVCGFPQHRAEIFIPREEVLQSRRGSLYSVNRFNVSSLELCSHQYVSLMFCGRSLSFVFLLAFSPILGCADGAPQLVPVHGELFVKSQPAAGALIVLTPAGDPKPDAWRSGYPRASVKDDGSFDVGTFAQEDGAPAGDYVLTISWLVPEADPNEVNPGAALDRLNGRYLDPNKSKLTISVTSPETVLPRISLK